MIAYYSPILVLGGALLGMVCACIPGLRNHRVVCFACALGLVAAMLLPGEYSIFFNKVFAAVGLLALLASPSMLERDEAARSDYYILLLFSVVGMMVMTIAKDLLVVFLGLELMSLPLYALVAFRRGDRKGHEAAMKYFVLGAVGSAIFLYGVALLYGATGSTVFAVTGSGALFSLAGAMLLTGFLFKVAAVPFHMWLPDVYEGAPTVITGFMVSGAKAAAFIVLIRVFMLLGGGKWLDAIWWCALLTMILGNFAALAQTNLKRMLGYSSIAHTGYLLVGFVSAPGASIGYGPVVMYLVIYAVMNLGAFILLAAIGSRDDTGLNLHDLAGFSRRRPWVAFAFAVFLLSMAGLPPTAGFAAKFTLFYSAVQAGQVPLVVLGILCSAVSIYYYLRVLVWMYMRDPVGETVKSRISVWAAGAIIMMVLLVLYFGVNPEPLVSAAKGALAGI